MSRIPASPPARALSADDARTRLTVTVTEAAELLGIGRQSAYAAVRAGEIPSVKIGHRILVPTAQLLALVSAATE
ncbi:helix-turn-helix domain-containing protein [Clavibacter capsici]|uniref:helix-turn-helix domain-containing protein n=1 Tax=Clavibacter capsici TaxID=1874630 RepID=UPI001C54E985|nr:helix-turn-helix domain-containing protein [Clavibacter capsici]